MDDAVDVFVAFVDLAVDEAFRVTLRRVGVDGCCVADVVFFEIFSAGHERRGQGLRDEECFVVLRVAEGDVAVG